MGSSVKPIHFAGCLCALAVLLALPARSGAQDATELAKQTQNPVASFISVPFQGNWDFGLGDRDATGTLLNIQPVMPFGVNPSTNVILPVTSQPGPGGMRLNGLVWARPLWRSRSLVPGRSASSSTRSGR